jgi:nitroreductase
MDVREAIVNRLSIRQYAETPVPPGHMERLLRALQLAPSANNTQNWEFVFVADPALKRRLVSACFQQQFVGDCTYFIAGVVDPSLKWHQVDITIALTNFTLQATELGYGTCWIGSFDETMVKGLLAVPKEKKILVCMTFGRPRGRHLPRGRKAVADFVYLNNYGHPWNPMS